MSGEWQPMASLPRDATVLVTVVPGPQHSYPDKCKPKTHPAYIDEFGRVCDCGTWSPDLGLHGTHWQTVAWMPMPDPAAIATEARRAETTSGSVHEGAGPQDIAQRPDHD